MARCNRCAPGGMVFHVLNRGVGRMKLFQNDSDYLAFERVIAETLKVQPIRICCYCLMPNHWHLLLWPERDNDLAAFMQRLTITHVARWQRQRRRVGFGHIYQGRFKSFPVSKDKYFHDVAHYIERNAQRAKLVKRAADWRWSSLWRKEHESVDDDWQLSSWPVRRPSDWRKLVSAPQDVSKLKALRECIRRGRPYGPEDWVAMTAAELGLEPSLRPRGRPRKSV